MEKGGHEEHTSASPPQTRPEGGGTERHPRLRVLADLRRNGQRDPIIAQVSNTHATLIVKFRPNRAMPETTCVNWTPSQYLCSLLLESDGSRDPS